MTGRHLTTPVRRCDSLDCASESPTQKPYHLVFVLDFNSLPGNKLPVPHAPHEHIYGGSTIGIRPYLAPRDSSLDYLDSKMPSGQYESAVQKIGQFGILHSLRDKNGNDFAGAAHACDP